LEKKKDEEERVKKKEQFSKKLLSFILHSLSLLHLSSIRREGE